MDGLALGWFAQSPHRQEFLFSEIGQRLVFILLGDEHFVVNGDDNQSPCWSSGPTLSVKKVVPRPTSRKQPKISFYYLSPIVPQRTSEGDLRKMQDGQTRQANSEKVGLSSCGNLPHDSPLGRG